MTGYDGRLQVLRDRFLARAAEDRDALARAVAASDREEIRRLAHRICGSGGTFGFQAVSNAAREIEDALDADVSMDRIGDLARALTDRLDLLGDA